MEIIAFFILTLIVGFVSGLVVSGVRKKYDGYLDVSEQDTSQIHQLEIMTAPEKLKTQSEVTFKVRKIPNTI